MWEIDIDFEAEELDGFTVLDDNGNWMLDDDSEDDE